MKNQDLPVAVLSETTAKSTSDELQRHWQNVVKRRSFLKGLGIATATATLSAGSLLATEGKAATRSSKGKLSPGDVAILQFLCAAEILESDLWSQYAELGGVNGFNGGNPAYTLALQNLDSDMPQYIRDNTDDELSHAAFLNAYLLSKGEQPVNLDKFRTLPSLVITLATAPPATLIWESISRAPSSSQASQPFL
jgi:hypothetical protein